MYLCHTSFFDILIRRNHLRKSKNGILASKWVNYPFWWFLPYRAYFSKVYFSSNSFGRFAKNDYFCALEKLILWARFSQETIFHGSDQIICEIFEMTNCLSMNILWDDILKKSCIWLEKWIPFAKNRIEQKNSGLKINRIDRNLKCQKNKKSYVIINRTDCRNSIPT